MYSNPPSLIRKPFLKFSPRVLIDIPSRFITPVNPVEIAALSINVPHEVPTYSSNPRSLLSWPKL